MLFIVFGLSYCSEWPKYQFEKKASRGQDAMPGARLIDSHKSADLVSPVSWIWPATTTWNYAIPDPVMEDRFFIVTLIYDEEPIALLVDVECEDRSVDVYGLNGKDSAPAARDIWGDPVEAPDGRTYRLYDLTVTPLAENELHQLCDTDWTREKRAVAGEALKGSTAEKH